MNKEPRLKIKEKIHPSAVIVSLLKMCGRVMA